MPPTSQFISGILIAVLLNGCVTLSGTFSVDRFLYQDITGDTYGACAARTYQAWARHKAWVQVNYAGAAALAERAAAVKSGSPPAPFPTCGNGARAEAFHAIALQKPDRACACGNAAVEQERLNCAGPHDDSAVSQRRFEAAVAACEGRS